MQESFKETVFLARILQGNLFLARFLQDVLQKNALSCKTLEENLARSLQGTHCFSTRVVTTDLEPLIFQNVVLNASVAHASLQNVVFLEEINVTSNPQRVEGDTHLGTVIFVALVYRAIPQQLANTKTKTEVKNARMDSSVCNVYEAMNLSTESQLTSSSEIEFLSSTDPTEEGLSDCEKRKRTGPELMAPISGPESQVQEVKYLWVSEASASLENILTNSMICS